jgi:hypothetical protein
MALDVFGDGGNRHAVDPSKDPSSASAELPGGAELAGEPFLPDSGQAPSRDLAQGDGQGEAGAGRGGPSETEKSRQAVPLLLGVAMPDTLQGILGVGPAQIRLLRMTPHTGSRPSAVAKKTRPVDAGESPVISAPVDPEIRATVRQFMLLQHGSRPEPAGLTPNRGDLPPTEK